jgi:hypothetical protein
MARDRSIVFKVLDTWLAYGTYINLPFRTLTKKPAHIGIWIDRAAQVADETDRMR